MEKEGDKRILDFGVAHQLDATNSLHASLLSRLLSLYLPLAPVYLAYSPREPLLLDDCHAEADLAKAPLLTSLLPLARAAVADCGRSSTRHSPCKALSCLATIFHRAPPNASLRRPALTAAFFEMREVDDECIIIGPPPPYRPTAIPYSTPVVGCNARDCDVLVFLSARLYVCVLLFFFPDFPTHRRRSRRQS